MIEQWVGSAVSSARHSCAHMCKHLNGQDTARAVEADHNDADDSMVSVGLRDVLTIFQVCLKTTVRCLYVNT